MIFPFQGLQGLHRRYTRSRASMNSITYCAALKTAWRLASESVFFTSSSIAYRTRKTLFLLPNSLSLFSPHSRSRPFIARSSSSTALHFRRVLQLCLLEHCRQSALSSSSMPTSSPSPSPSLAGTRLLCTCSGCINEELTGPLDENGAACGDDM